jgi:hypothetical protein
VLGDVDVHDAAAVVRNQDEHEEHAARQRRDGEEIHRDEGGEVVGEEGPPRLGRWTRELCQQSRHGALGDLNPQLPELAVDARGTPQGIGAGHVGEEFGDVRIERGPTRAVASRALRPPPTQPGAMPSDDSLGLDENQCRPPPAPGGRQQDPKHAVTGAEVMPLHASLQGSQLVAEGKILEDHVVVATAGYGDRPQEQQCQFNHVQILSGVAAESNASSAMTTFWRTTTTYVEPFPPTGTKHQIARGGRPLWSRDGKELFHVPNADQLMVVTIRPQPSFTFMDPVAVPQGFGIADPASLRSFDITPEGRIIGIGSAGQSQIASAPAQINVVLNWFEELKARVPTK